jgi:hypothetical protein
VIKGSVKRKPGRPHIGERRVISITLPENEWEKVESLITAGHATSSSDYFRQLHGEFHRNLSRGKYRKEIN